MCSYMLQQDAQWQQHNGILTQTTSKSASCSLFHLHHYGHTVGVLMERSKKCKVIQQHSWTQHHLCCNTMPNRPVYVVIKYQNQWAHFQVLCYLMSMQRNESHAQTGLLSDFHFLYSNWRNIPINAVLCFIIFLNSCHCSSVLSQCSHRSNKQYLKRMAQLCEPYGN